MNLTPAWLKAPRVWLSLLLALGGMVGIGQAVTADAPDFLSWAPRPPMGWNSWDCYATTITEAQTKAEASYFAEHLKTHGWEYVVVDIQWYEPGANGFDYHAGAKLSLDEYGRLVPAANKFPSSIEGAGFKPLADYVHGLGLKFGIHLMRGIPRQAVQQNTPIFRTPFHAADIADKVHVCEWNSDMYGVDMSKPGAQAYYDSVFALIASWGVDFVKVDDLSRPYHQNQPEVEAIRKAIDRAGRPMVLSLSPGETALDAGAHVQLHANMWRISDDFWDSWGALREQFERLDKWNQYRQPGAWPDADMLPLGVLEMGKRRTHFTKEEQFTLMTLWSIARSPLVFGGDLLKMDDFTLSLLTNDEVLAVNQQSAGNRPLFNREGLIGWCADVPGSADKYLALFNARDPFPLLEKEIVASTGVVSRKSPGHRLPVSADLRSASHLVLVVNDAGDGNGWDDAIWISPTITLKDGSRVKLTDLNWQRATAGWGEVLKQKTPGGKPIMVDRQPVKDGIGAHANSTIEYELPAGSVRFDAEGAIDDGALTQAMGATVCFLVYAQTRAPGPEAAGVKIPVDWNTLGLNGPVTVRDLWAHRDLGEVLEFAPEIPWHGAGLYRVSAGRR